MKKFDRDEFIEIAGSMTPMLLVSEKGFRNVRTAKSAERIIKSSRLCLCSLYDISERQEIRLAFEMLVGCNPPRRFYSIDTTNVEYIFPV